MKKVLLSLFLILSLIICCGCSDDKPPVIDNDENFGEQRFLYATTWGGRLIRYDVVDKKATVACPNPQCNHDGNCLVTKIDRLTVSDDYLLYVRGEFAGDIYCYDIKAGKIDKIHSAAQSSALYLINKTVFFSASQYEYNEDGSLKSEVWNVYKYDIVSENLTKINDTPIAASVRVIRHTDDTIIWRGEGTIRFSTDYDFNVIEENLPSQPQVVGEYIYRAGSHYHDGNYIYKMDRSNDSGDITETIQDGMLSFRWDNPDDPERLIYYPLAEKAIYSIDLDTLENKKLCDIPNGISLTDIFVVEGNDYRVGNYIALYVHNSGEEDEESKLTSESLMFVDVTTGEYFIITP